MTDVDKALITACVVAVLGTFAAGLVYRAIREPETRAPSVSQQMAPPQEASMPLAEQAANLEQCRSKLKAAAQVGLLTDMGYTNSGLPKVVVGRTWYGIDYSAKTGLAQTAACFFLAGDTSKGIRFDIRDNMTGKVVASWSGSRLTVE